MCKRLVVWVTRYAGIHVNSLWPSDVIRRHRPESTMPQVMAWCLMAPSHYLKQCWLIIKCNLVHSPDIDMKSICNMCSEGIHLKLLSSLPGAYGLNNGMVCLSAGRIRYIVATITLQRSQQAGITISLYTHSNMDNFTILFCRCFFCVRLTRSALSIFCCCQSEAVNWMLIGYLLPT